MLIGHYAPALIVKGLKPQLPLWQLFIAVQLVDIAWILFCLGQWESFSLNPALATNPLVLEHQPLSHSLPAALLWGMAGLGLGWLINGRRWPEAGLLALLVTSHWWLDLPVHRPDLLIWGNWKVGLALWNTTYLAMALEFSMFAACAWWANRRIQLCGAGRGLLIVLAGLLVVNYLTYPPLNGLLILASAMAVYLLTPLAAWWLERRQIPVEAPTLG